MTKSDNQFSGIMQAPSNLPQVPSRTQSYSVMWLNIERNRQLLELSISGIQAREKMTHELTKKLSKPKSIAYGSSKEDEIDDKPGEPVEVEQYSDHDVIKLEIEDNKNDYRPVELTGRQANLLLRVVTKHVDYLGDLRFHLHNVICVSIWSAFEGYIQSALTELFTADPSLLASERPILTSDVIAARERLIDFLVEREISEIGRKNFNDLQKYLKSKIKYQASSKDSAKMSELYFLRNVIAHSAGYIREQQIPLVPANVDVVEKQIRISKDYLDVAISQIEHTAVGLDKRIISLIHDANTKASIRS